MATHTSLPNDKLSAWYFSVRWAIGALQDRIQKHRDYGWSTTYDEHQLDRLEDLEQYLKMSWDTWMEELKEDLTTASIGVAGGTHHE